MGMTQPEVDQDLIAGHAQLDLRGAGAPADRILSSPALKANADSALTGFLRFAYINTQVVPNVHCRAAIEYAADKTALQAAYGGPEAGGQIASTVLPPTVLGYRAFDLYQATTRPGGDIEDARAELRKCGKPGGFGVSIAYRSDQPGDQPAATALQAALRRAGIRATLRGFPETKYFTFFAGVPTYVHAHDIGVALGTWGADWPDGFGFLYDLSDGSAIIPAGNSNIAEINDPVINNLFSRAMTAPSATAVWPKIDLQIMKDAAILPIVYQKVLLYRPPDLTNVFVQDVWGSYDYAVLGRQQ
jgi:peptide/nickel transport system substrate-binding protein